MKQKWNFDEKAQFSKQVFLQFSPLLVVGAISEKGSETGPPWPIDSSIGLSRESKLSEVDVTVKKQDFYFYKIYFPLIRITLLQTFWQAELWLPSTHNGLALVIPFIILLLFYWQMFNNKLFHSCRNGVSLSTIIPECV